jgi:hypothetical protein
MVRDEWGDMTGAAPCALIQARTASLSTAQSASTASTAIIETVASSGMASGASPAGPVVRVNRSGLPRPSASPCRLQEHPLRERPRHCSPLLFGSGGAAVGPHYRVVASINHSRSPSADKGGRQHLSDALFLPHSSGWRPKRSWILFHEPSSSGNSRYGAAARAIQSITSRSSRVGAFWPT